MVYRYVFDDNKKVSLIGFGGWQLGNSESWKGPSYEEGINLVKEAFRHGVNFFDTAPNYGQGNSELILGEALKDVREQVVINTKIGHGPDGAYEFTYEGVMKSVERSLGKLQTSYLDSVILHNPERYILEGKSDLFLALEELKSIGKIKKYGVSIDTLEELDIVLNNLHVDTIEIMFNIIHQEPKYLFEQIKERNILLIIKVPLDSGWLTGKYNKDSVFDDIRSRWSSDIIETRASIVSRLQNILGTASLVGPALKFISSFPAVSTIIPGTKNIGQLQANIASLDYPLSKKSITDIEDLYESFIKNKETPW